MCPRPNAGLFRHGGQNSMNGKPTGKASSKTSGKNLTNWKRLRFVERSRDQERPRERSRGASDGREFLEKGQSRFAATQANRYDAPRCGFAVVVAPAKGLPDADQRRPANLHGCAETMIA